MRNGKPREHSTEQVRRWRAKNKKRQQETSRKYNVANKTAIAEKQKEYRKENRKRIDARVRTWCAENPERRKQITAKWAKANPDKILEYTNRRRARLAAVAVPLTTVEQAQVIGFYATARAMTELSGESYHVDHIKPLSKGGTHRPDNLQVLRGVDNLRKGAKL